MLASWDRGWAVRTTALVIALGAFSPALAHEDPPGCFETGPAIVVSVFRSDGTTGVVGSVSECETINYRATLQKASNSPTLCAFSGGSFTLTTPDGVAHTISANVPCIGGTSGEGCDATVTQVQSALVPYTVSAGDIAGGLVTATAGYAGGVAHDQPGNTTGVSATTPKSTPVVRCADTDACTQDVCDPTKQGSAACSHPPVDCGDGNACTTDACDPASGQCVHTPGGSCDDGNACTTDTCDPATGQCVHTGGGSCDDGNLCTMDSCDPATGQCVHKAKVCNDNNKCTTDACKPSTGQCVYTPKVCNDYNLCTTDKCDPYTGQCVFSRYRRW